MKHLRTLVGCGLLVLPAIAARAETVTPPQKGPTVPAMSRCSKAASPTRRRMPRAISNWPSGPPIRSPKSPTSGAAATARSTTRGYDCSGTISYFLHQGGLLDQPTPSKAFQSYGECGPGKWVTIWARSGHVFAYVCGLRLDTTGLHQEEGPRWRGDYREPRGFIARHPAGM
ncbi:MAG: hypothetical protein WDN28_05365 [Chthoniobacter sp.]